MMVKGKMYGISAKDINPFYICTTEKTFNIKAFEDF